MKKDVKLVQKEANALYDEIIQTGYKEDLAKTISDDMRNKGGYLFNKSHSFSYAVLCLQTAYLKAHYPLYFYKALFNLRKGDNGKLNKYITDALNNNIQVLPPKINKSDTNFTVYNDKILFGLSSINGLGQTSVEPLIEERNNNGLYKSLDDLKSRINLSDSQLVSLVKSGAIPCKSKYNLLEKYINNYILERKEYTPVKTLPQLSKLQMCGIDTDKIKEKEKRLSLYNKFKEQEFINRQNERNLKKTNEFKNKYMIDEEMWEFEALSIFLTHNPFKDLDKKLPYYDEVSNNSDVTIVGVIANTVVKKNSKKQQYAFITLCTAYGLVEICCWAYTYAQFNEIIKKGNRLAILCNKQDDKYSAKDIKQYNKWKSDLGIA